MKNISNAFDIQLMYMSNEYYRVRIICKYMTHSQAAENLDALFHWFVEHTHKLINISIDELDDTDDIMYVHIHTNYINKIEKYFANINYFSYGY